MKSRTPRSTAQGTDQGRQIEGGKKGRETGPSFNRFLPPLVVWVVHDGFQNHWGPNRGE